MTDRGDPAPALIALEGAAATAAAVGVVLGRLVSAGHRIVRPPIERAIGRAPSGSTVLEIPVADESGARAAVEAALAGFGIVVVASAERSVLDRLYDDLRRFGSLDVRGRPPVDIAAALDPEERTLLRLLTEGLSLGDAAAGAHVSRRTADRRLASARRKLGVTTTLEAIARLRSGSKT